MAKRNKHDPKLKAKIVLAALREASGRESAGFVRGFGGETGARVGGID